jgi:hypothetical protein
MCPIQRIGRTTIVDRPNMHISASIPNQMLQKLEVCTSVL